MQDRMASILLLLVGIVNAQLMPYPAPASMLVGQISSLHVLPSVRVELAEPGQQPGPVFQVMLARAQGVLAAKAQPSHPGCPANVSLALVTVQVASLDETLGSTTDESYTLHVGPGSGSAGSAMPVALLTAATIYGVRHGLETMAQLVQPDLAATSLTAACGAGGWIDETPVSINDTAASSYRGLMVDTSRHFLDLQKLYDIVRGMGRLKLNVLHVHWTDSSSFPIASQRYPALAASGAYAPAAVYNGSALRGLVQYAKSHGVRIVPEFDMPGHGSWFLGMPQWNLSSCSDVFNPTNPALYSFLRAFLLEMVTIFDDDMLMLGGDEVGFDPKCSWPGCRVCGYHCYDRDPTVAAWMLTVRMIVIV